MKEDVRRSPLEDLFRRLENTKQKYNTLRNKEAYQTNKDLYGKYYKFENRSSYDPWFTFIKIKDVLQTSLNAVRVDRFEITVQKDFIYAANDKRKIELLGDEITEREYRREFTNFKAKIRP